MPGRVFRFLSFFLLEKSHETIGRGLAVMVGVCALSVSPSFAADVAGPVKPGIVEPTPNMPASALAGRPDSDLVEQRQDGRAG
jgi:hypothetical protein